MAIHHHEATLVGTIIKAAHHHEAVRNDDVVLVGPASGVVHRAEHAFPKRRRPVIHIRT